MSTPAVSLRGLTKVFAGSRFRAMSSTIRAALGSMPNRSMQRMWSKAFDVRELVSAAMVFTLSSGVVVNSATEGSPAERAHP